MDLTLNATIPWDIELTGGVEQARRRPHRRSTSGRSRCTAAPTTFASSLGQPVGRRAHPPRTAARRSSTSSDRPACAVQLRIDGGAGGIAFDRQKLGGVGGGTVARVGRMPRGAADRFSIELAGGAGRIVVRETAGG